MSIRSATGDSIAALAPELDALAAEAMAEWKIPAASLAVVQNGETVLAKAWGDRDVEAALPATPQTKFLICSISKTFTATALALLADEGRLDWSKPVRDYLPEFRLHDAVATERVTVRDLLCHHTGLPRHDWIWMPGGLSRVEMLAALRHLEPSCDIRTAWQYSNLAYNAASVVIERISGQSFEDFVRERLTDRLRMSVSFTAGEVERDDIAVPYLVNRDVRVRGKFWPIHAIAAGAIHTSAADIANWMKFLLAEGEFAGERLLSAARLHEMWMPRVHESAPEFPEFGHIHYGLGFRVSTYRGARTIGHSGGWMGWSSLMRLMPELNLGITVLTSASANPLPAILINRIADRAGGHEPVAWLERFRDLRRKALAQQKSEDDARAARPPGKPSSRDLVDYVGAYQHPAYGRMLITANSNGLHWSWRGMQAPLSHRHHDTFELPEIVTELHPDRLLISFNAGRDGNIASLSAPLEPAVAAIMFTRVNE